ncbi:MAG: hypothetical protein AAGU21_20250 [Solidesulfovibrio sp.]|uniref:hypothetical protein n=1 Tax=Solidesulfovibrio sp. TaxID=2910990 RepID=UPI002B1F3610|nr:hypothetical protein [Solidesulfovibrio sp.]MEA4856665.1 hypothetical protein [Solidesulfovibrio sp.]
MLCRIETEGGVGREVCWDCSKKRFLFVAAACDPHPIEKNDAPIVSEVVTAAFGAFGCGDA